MMENQVGDDGGIVGNGGVHEHGLSPGKWLMPVRSPVRST